MGSGDDPAGRSIRASRIKAGFAPRTPTSVAALELDGETVLADPERRTFCLDAVGTIVWSCFDGSSTLEQISADLADAFGADRGAVRRDVVELSRQLGSAGLLDGVAPDEPVHTRRAQSEALPVGSTLAGFDHRGLAGGRLTLDSLRGRRTLLVNWDPLCQFCVGIAAQLGDLEPTLRRRGMGLLLLATGDADRNLHLAGEHGLASAVALVQDGRPEAFGGYGTPAAYVVGEDGRIASSLALGAVEVLDAARRLSGHGPPRSGAAGQEVGAGAARVAAPRFLAEPPST